MRKLDNYAQANQMLLLLMLMFVLMFVFSDPNISSMMLNVANTILYPVIGFGGEYPVFTLFLAGLIVVTLSSLLTNFFTDWKKMGESQELSKAFQKEMTKARKEGNTNRLNKLMKMQPEIMKKQTDASSGMFKPMIFLMIFIWPIFMWLRAFLGGLDYYYLTLPWENTVSLIPEEGKFLFQTWLWIYLFTSMMVGQVLRGGFKWISWTPWWEKAKKKILPFNR